MTRQEALDIMQNEDLERFAFFGLPYHPNRVLIYKRGAQWIVENTDERAAPGATRPFVSEENALDLFVQRLRLSAVE